MILTQAPIKKKPLREDSEEVLKTSSLIFPTISVLQNGAGSSTGFKDFNLNGCQGFTGPVPSTFLDKSFEQNNVKKQKSPFD